MSLQAVLAVGWHDDVAEPGAAVRLFDLALGSDDGSGLREVLRRERPPIVRGLDRLFRLRVGGFERLKAMTSALLEYAGERPEDVFCHIDAFAYAFLRAAKNFDLLLPEARSHPPEAEPERAFRAVLPAWREEIESLREFERVGAEIPAASREAYLALRRIVARSSARDELRALALLVASGPSTAEDIAADLGLSYSLGDRVFGALHEAGALERTGEVFAVADDSLPRVLFCLNATVGMDYLGILGTGG